MELSWSEQVLTLFNTYKFSESFLHYLVSNLLKMLFVDEKEIMMFFLGWQGIYTFVALCVFVSLLIFIFAKKLN